MGGVMWKANDAGPHWALACVAAAAGEWAGEWATLLADGLQYITSSQMAACVAAASKQQQLLGGGTGHGGVDLQAGHGWKQQKQEGAGSSCGSGGKVLTCRMAAGAEAPAGQEWWRPGPRTPPTPAHPEGGC